MAHRELLNLNKHIFTKWRFRDVLNLLFYQSDKFHAELHSLYQSVYQSYLHYKQIHHTHEVSKFNKFFSIQVFQILVEFLSTKFLLNILSLITVVLFNLHKLLILKLF